MESTMLINSKLRCPEENLPTDIWIMTIDGTHVWIAELGHKMYSQDS